MKRHAEHQTFSIWLDDEWFKDGHLLINSRSEKQILNRLRRILFEKISKAKNCAVCGGLNPDLEFKYQGNIYRFTCYRITNEEGETIAKTNYLQFAKYCLAHHPELLEQQTKVK